MSYVRYALASAILASAMACQTQAPSPSGADEERVPLGKADAVGSCRSDDTDLCGGKSEGHCWCDAQCVDFGDCCSDRIAVCEGLELSVETITDEATFDAMAFSGEGSVVIGKTVKFVIDNRDRNAPVLRFMNAGFNGASDPDAAKFHFNFTRAVFQGVTNNPATFNDSTYFTQDKDFFAGTIAQYRVSDTEPVIYGIQFYPQDVIAEGSVLLAAKMVRESFTVEDARVAFVATGPQQTTTTVSGDLASLGVEDLTLDRILGTLNYLPMQLGEAWGFLRIFPQDHDQLSAIDIPVFDELPLDLTVVAGTITSVVQDASSHINLKSKERGTPNMVLRDASLDHATLSEFADKPVHLIVAPDGFTIELSTDDEVRAKLAEKLDKPWQPLEIDRDAELTSYDDMCPSGASGCLGLAPQFGGKAGNLGFLRHPDVLGAASDPGSISAGLDYDVAPAGLGVPVRYYFEMLELPANAELAAELDAFIAGEREGILSVAERVERLERIREGFLLAELPDGLADDVTALAHAVMPADVRNLKIRSSANAEDIPGFDGAGLYESYRARLDDEPNPDGSCEYLVRDDGSHRVEPRTVDCVIKGVYASLWNKRAVEERSFARIDHATAGMGLAIVQRYREKDRIGANSIVVTRVLNSSGVFGYTFSAQVDNNVVTNPAPNTQSETVIAAFLPNIDPSFTVTRFAKPEEAEPTRTETVMTNEQMRQQLELTQAVELAYCRAKPEYYAGPCGSVTFDVDKPTSLDMELKLYENGDFLIKQVREFAGK